MACGDSVDNTDKVNESARASDTGAPSSLPSNRSELRDASRAHSEGKRNSEADNFLNQCCLELSDDKSPKSRDSNPSTRRAESGSASPADRLTTSEREGRTTAPADKLTTSERESRTTAPADKLTTSERESRTTAPADKLTTSERDSRTTAPADKLTTSERESRTTAPADKLTTSERESRTSAPADRLTTSERESRTSAPADKLTTSERESRTTAPADKLTTSERESRTSAPADKLTERTDRRPDKPTKATDKNGNEVTTFPADDKDKRVKQTSFFDRKHGDALRETEFKGRDDKMVRQTDFLNRQEKVFQDGSKVTEFDRGDRRNPHPDIVRIHESPDGNIKRTEFKDDRGKASEVIDYKNGRNGLVQRTWSEATNEEVSRYKDGTVRKIDKDGNETVTRPETKQEPTKSTDKNGNDVTSFPADDKEKRVKTTSFSDRKHGDALRETEFKGRDDKMVRQTDFLNRQEKVFQDGSKVTEFDRGDRRNPHPDIVRIHESPDGNIKRTEFKDDRGKASEVIDYKNGRNGLVQRTWSEATNEEVSRYKDGTVRKIDKDGNETVTRPETKQEPTKSTDKNGNDVTSFPADDKEKRVKTTSFSDRKHGDALRETEFKGRDDKMVRQTDFLNRQEKVFQDGSKVTEFDWGDRRNPHPDIVRIHESPDGNIKRTEFKDDRGKASEVIDYKNGRNGLVQRTWSEATNEEVSYYKDGTVRRIDKDGNETVTKRK